MDTSIGGREHSLVSTTDRRAFSDSAHKNDATSR
jgi:hypothetical protein